MHFFQKQTHDFFDEDPLPLFSAELGPWVRPASTLAQPHPSKPKPNLFIPKQISLQNKKPLNRTICTSGRNYRTTHSRENSIVRQETNQEQDPVQILSRKKFIICYPLSEQKTEGTRPIVKKCSPHATMYIYHSDKQPPKGNRTDMGPGSFMTICKQKDTTAFKGSQNLQKILRVKEKMRAKNSLCVQKMKEKVRSPRPQQLVPSVLQERIQSMRSRGWTRAKTYQRQLLRTPQYPSRLFELNV